MNCNQTKKLQNRIIEFLQTNQHTQLCEDTILQKAKSVGYKEYDVRQALRTLTDDIAHVGKWWVKEEGTTYYRWYEPNELTDKVQECLDRGDDW